MFLLLPTCDTHARVCEITATLLTRYWPDHSPLHVLHGAVRPRISRARMHRVADHWLAGILSFLSRCEDELFLLLLDDYALCAPAKTDIIRRAEQLMLQDVSVGMFPLCWYPAARRAPRAGHDGIETLAGAPMLLQAAIWRKSWFVQLSRQMDPRTTPWGFETAATQLAKRMPMEICCAAIPRPAHVGGHLLDALDKRDWPLPYHNLMHRGQPQLAYEPFLASEGFSFPSRGLGDTFARVAQRTGIAQVASAMAKISGRDCGCQERRDILNRMLPYK